MKKLKIFLMLGLLLCFGFALSPEVHAQGDGPKLFEVGDVLPATTQLKIELIDVMPGSPGQASIKTANNNKELVTMLFPDWDHGITGIYINGSMVVYDNGYSSIIDTSEWTLEQRTVSHVDSKLVNGTNAKTYFTNLNPPSGYTITFNSNGGSSISSINDATELPTPLPTPTKENHTFLGWYYDSSLTNRAFPGDTLTTDIVLYAKWGFRKIFEVGDVLPATTQLKIYISGIHGDGNDRYYISSTIDHDNSQGFYMATVQSDPNYNLYIIINGVPIIGLISPNDDPFPDYVIIDTSSLSRSDRTIRYCDYPEEMGVMWEDLNPPDLESVYQEGYEDGYQDARDYYGWEVNGYWHSGLEAWNMGNEYAMEIYGYYDPITDQWLSVSGYLELYGTDKMGQSDFYNNFDKYFIPAMIIVFGGAIVLTILKVFKGRE